MAKEKYYAYFFDTNNMGIKNSWDECKKIVQGTSARYKSFTSKEEAEFWLNNGAIYEKKSETLERKILQNQKLEDAVYFDAGTGRGLGVEVRIADKNKKSLIESIRDEKFEKFLENKKWTINEFGNIQLDKRRTNNFGELLGLYLALEIATQLKVSKIFGDSRLVIDYWSLGRFNLKNLETETVTFIKKVTENRKKFEENGGELKHISGDINPADLGFHK